MFTALGSAAKHGYIGGYRALLGWGICRPPQPVLIMSHYRSGSSLLTRILASHPDILGSGETVTCYANPDAFFKAELKNRRGMKRYLRPYRFSLDKVNDNHLTPAPQLLWQLPVKVILLTRELPNSFSSLLSSINDYRAHYPRARALDYYRKRLIFMASFADSYPGDNCTWVNYEDIVADSDNVLSSLSHFLGLPSPLSSNYDTHRIPWKYGDPSIHLRQGTIIDTGRSRHPDLNDDILAELQELQAQCYRRLARFHFRRTNTHTDGTGMA